MTLRTRLTLILLATLAPLGVAVQIGLYVFVRSALTARLDDALAARAAALAAAVRVEPGGLGLDAEDMPTSDYRPPPRGETGRLACYEIWALPARPREADAAAQPRLLERSASLGSSRLWDPGGAPPADRAWDLELPGDTDGRALARRVTPTEHEAEPGGAPAGAGDGAAALVVVAVSREPVDGPLSALAIGLACATGAFVVVGVVVVRWSLARGLRPVMALARAVSAIDPSRLPAEVEAPPGPRELEPIRDRLNDLLRRVDAALGREKRFTAAAAHELRTPVAELRTLLEVAASRPRTAEEANATIRTATNTVERLDRLVSALLRLTRIESGRQQALLAPVALRPALDAAVARARAAASARGVRFDIDLPAQTAVLADPELLDLALSNLVSNAAEYADAHSMVTINFDRRGDHAGALAVANTATDLVWTDDAPLGEPLRRTDAARTPSGHLGLGIALVRAACRAMGAELDIRFNAGAGAQVTAEITFGAPNGAGRDAPRAG